MPSLEIPDQVQLNSLTATEGALSAYGPGAKPLITLDLNDMTMDDTDNFAGEGDGEELEGPQARC